MEVRLMTTSERLQEDRADDRKGQFLVMGARREKGQLAPVMFVGSAPAAQAAADALRTTGFTTVEVYTRVEAP
jgi:hypothetical protein